MSRKIRFYLRDDLDATIEHTPHPAPAGRFMPEWYKHLEADVKEQGGCPIINPRGNHARTLKGCIPFLDALTGGYIVPLPADLTVHPNTKVSPNLDGSEQDMVMEPCNGLRISRHGHQQLGMMPRESHDAYKFDSPWIVEVPKGYSILFTQPLNRPELPFRCFTGIVDCDRYFTPVNLPFDWVDPDFNGVLPAGTPMVHLIPFKRDSWTHEVLEADAATMKRARASDSAVRLYAKDVYKRLFWTKKEWK